MRHSSSAPLKSALLALALALSALPAAAQPGAGAPSAAEEDRRTRLFKEGKAAADAGQWAEAAAKFRQVITIRSAPKALIALGVAEEKQGHLVAAQIVYKQARDEAAEKNLIEEIKTANTALDAVRPRLCRLTFSPADALGGARLEVDGNEARPDNGTLLADPGEHTLTASAAGKGTFRTTITLKEGEQREIAVTFGAAASSSSGGQDPVDPPRNPDKGAGPPTGALVIAGVGVALAGAGAALFGVGSGEYAKSDELCPGAACTKDVLDRGNGGRTQIIAGDILMIAGGAAIAGGTLWWIVSAASSKKSPPTSLFIAPRAAGLQLGGRF